MKNPNPKTQFWLSTDRFWHTVILLGWKLLEIYGSTDGCSEQTLKKFPKIYIVAKEFVLASIMQCCRVFVFYGPRCTIVLFVFWRFFCTETAIVTRKNICKTMFSWVVAVSWQWPVTSSMPVTRLSLVSRRSPLAPFPVAIRTLLFIVLFFRTSLRLCVHVLFCNCKML